MEKQEKYYKVCYYYGKESIGTIRYCSLNHMLDYTLQENMIPKVGKLFLLTDKYEAIKMADDYFDCVVFEGHVDGNVYELSFIHNIVCFYSHKLRDVEAFWYDMSKIDEKEVIVPGLFNDWRNGYLFFNGCRVNKFYDNFVVLSDDFTPETVIYKSQST